MNVFGLEMSEVALIIGIEIICAFGFMLFMLWHGRNHFEAFLLEPYLNTWKIKKKVWVNLKRGSFKWKTKAYTVNFSNAIANMTNRPILYYNYLTCKPIKPITGMDGKEDADTFKVMLDGNIMKNFGNRKMMNVYLAVIGGLIICMLIVAVFSIYQQGEMSKEIVFITKQLLNITRESRKVIVVP